MIDLVQALRDFVETFEQLQLPYVVMGGIAVRFYGIPRATYDVDFTVSIAPGNSYEYPDNQGHVRHIDMPDGVIITSSDSPITFEINGSLAAAATTVLEIELTSDSLERWTISTNIMGVSTTKRERIAI